MTNESKYLSESVKKEKGKLVRETSKPLPLSITE